MNERDMKRMPEGSKHYIRVNGVGNAWPVPLGTVHPFYDPGDPEQLANVSFSILKLSSDPVKGTIDPQSIEWEVLIDAGHGIVQYLIRHGNRMPDAVVLTHAGPYPVAGLDHTEFLPASREGKANAPLCQPAGLGFFHLLLPAAAAADRLS
jgi:hypothetical protein